MKISLRSNHNCCLYTHPKLILIQRYAFKISFLLYLNRTLYPTLDQNFIFVIYLNRTLYRTLDDDEKRDNQDYKKWYNGGGMFHNSARIDPTARIEIGALVHAESVVGANVSIGSGCIVGPAVTIGQSTRTGYCDLFILESSIFEIKAYLLSLRFIFLFAS